uniref:Uncharacterized protein n=1 Tax=Arundo donax TaxID=35708 RepID=A0A0A9FEG8_ARUDO
MVRTFLVFMIHWELVCVGCVLCILHSYLFAAQVCWCIQIILHPPLSRSSSAARPLVGVTTALYIVTGCLKS